ncbi:TetR/AcrR family transcriptional regulator [Alteromonas gracilis]
MSTVGTIRPGGRTARTRIAVLAATRAEILGHGYADFCVERVARRAGVHKTTIYRRWQDRTELVGDLIEASARATVVVPDTGSLQRDLGVLALGLREFLSGDSGALVAALFAAARQDDVLAALMREVLDARYDLMTPLVERAVERGEVPSGTDPSAVIRQTAAPLYYELMLTGRPIRRRDAERAARAAWLAARAGLFSG